jgi:2-keto-myo-inositol isomerase
MNEDQIAINSVTTRQRSLEEAAAAYAGAGFRNVEFVLPLLKEWLAGGRTVTDLAELLQSHGLRSIGGFETHLQCVAPDDVRRRSLETLVANARLVEELGGGVMVIGTDGPPRPSMEALDVLAAALRRLMEETEGLRVTIALEFNWSPLVRSLKSAVAVCGKVDHERLGVLFDPAHHYATPTKLEDMTADTVGWIRHVHVDDMRDKPADLSDCNSDRVLPGEGILDLGSIIDRLEAAGYRGYYSIEMFNEDLWALPAEAARRSFQSMLPLCRS